MECVELFSILASTEPEPIVEITENLTNMTYWYILSFLALVASERIIHN